jgi:hypothetical protein
MQRLSSTVTILATVITTVTLAQGVPGHGADELTSDSLETFDAMKVKPHGLLLNAYQTSHLGLDDTRMPNARGLFPVVDHPVHLEQLFPNFEVGKPIADAMAAIRKSITDPISLSFEPMAAWTFQHSPKTAGGGPGMTKSILWEAISSVLTLWQDQGNYGQVVCVLQNNVGVGKPLLPFMGPAVGDPGVVNNVLVSQHLTVDLYWQQSIFNNRLRVRVGKISESSFFDRNAVAYDPINGFMAEDFNQSLTNPFPSRGFGGVVSYDIDDNFTVRGSTINSASNGYTSGFDGLAINHLFSIAEADIRIFPEVWGVERQGHLRFMGWYNSIPNPNGAGAIGGWGGTFNMDLAVSDHATAFCRVGWGENDVTPANFAFSTGFGVTQPFGIKTSQTGIAFEYMRVTEWGRAGTNDFLNGASLVPAGDHYMMEWFWRVRLTKHSDTGPVIQVVRDASAGVDTAVIYGWRTSISF